MKRARRQAGMTLIEAMVAVTIFAAVATMVFGGFSQTMRNKERVERLSDRSHVIRISLERMVRELSMAFVSIHVNPNAQLAAIRTIFHGRQEGRASRLDFTSFSHRRLFRDAHESDQNELGYFVTEVRDERGDRVRALVRRESRRIDDTPEEGGQITVMVENVRDFELEYLDGTNQEWVQRWDSQGSEMNRLPLQVRIRLTVPSLLDPRRDEVFATRAVIPIIWALNHAVYNP